MDSSSSHGSLSTSDLEAAGSSGCNPCVPTPPPSCYRLFCDGLDEDDEPRHFLDSCSLCRKPLAGDCDIFMYRGDTPFCSKECRQEQIEMDEAKEKSWKPPVEVSTSRKERQKSGAAGAESQKIHVRASTAVAG